MIWFWFECVFARDQPKPHFFTFGQSWLCIWLRKNLAFARFLYYLLTIVLIWYHLQTNIFRNHLEVNCGKQNKKQSQNNNLNTKEVLDSKSWRQAFRMLKATSTFHELLGWNGVLRIFSFFNQIYSPLTFKIQSKRDWKDTKKTSTFDGFSLCF